MECENIASCTWSPDLCMHRYMDEWECSVCLHIWALLCLWINSWRRGSMCLICPHIAGMNYFLMCIKTTSPRWFMSLMTVTFFRESALESFVYVPSTPAEWENRVDINYWNPDRVWGEEARVGSTCVKTEWVPPDTSQHGGCWRRNSNVRHSFNTAPIKSPWCWYDTY